MKCTVASSMGNGVIMIVRDSVRNLRTRVASSEGEGRSGVKTKYQRAGVTCEVLTELDGTVEYFL